MPEPDLISYTGAVTGVIGAIAGIAGAVMGYIGFRRTAELKKLDLRVEVRKLLINTHSAAKETQDTMDRAYQSRRAIAAATGSLGSGRQRLWEDSLAKDRVEVQKLLELLPNTVSSFDKSSQSALETELLRLHAISSEVSTLRNRYAGDLQSDDKQRDHLRDDQRVEMQTRLSERK